MPVAVPIGAHDAAGEVELDVVDAVFDLLADGLNETVWPVAFAGLAGGEEVAACGGEEVAACEYAGARHVARVEDAPPCDVHEVGRAAAPDTGDSRLGEGHGQRAAEIGGFLGGGRPGRHWVFGMDVHVPEAGKQEGTLQVEHHGGAVGVVRNLSLFP